MAWAGTASERQPGFRRHRATIGEMLAICGPSGCRIPQEMSAVTFVA